LRAKIVIAVAVLAALAGAGIASAAVVATPYAGLTAASSSCSITVHSENGANDAIQDAVNTYPGGTICIGPGSFPEQVTISSSGTTLKGSGDASTIIDPSSLVANTYDYDNGGGPTALPAAAIILVEGPSGTPTTGVTGVTVENLQVNGGPGQGAFTGCGLDYFGVDFQASSGTLTNSNVTGIELPTALFGCQDGLAVYAYNGYYNFAGTNNEPDSVIVTHSLINQYDKNGITCNDPDESCTLSSNTVTGIGDNDLIAQNAIQIGFGALGTITSNHVSESGAYDGAGGCSGSAQGVNLNCTSDEGSGILLYDAATGSTVTSNTVSLCQYGIYVGDSGTETPETITINSNTVESSIAVGIYAGMYPGDTVHITSNTVNNEASENPSSGIWGAPGIDVDTGNFVISNDKVDGSSTAAGASDGASQEVCGPTGVYYVCPTAQSIDTAAIQGTSENGSYITSITISGVGFQDDSNNIATMGVLGGAVNIVLV
jgi:parallel beta-helix repeat protein